MARDARDISSHSLRGPGLASREAGLEQVSRPGPSWPGQSPPRLAPPLGFLVSRGFPRPHTPTGTNPSLSAAATSHGITLGLKGPRSGPSQGWPILTGLGQTLEPTAAHCCHLKPVSPTVAPCWDRPPLSHRLGGSQQCPHPRQVHQGPVQKPQAAWGPGHLRNVPGFSVAQHPALGGLRSGHVLPVPAARDPAPAARPCATTTGRAPGKAKLRGPGSHAGRATGSERKPGEQVPLDVRCPRRKTRLPRPLPSALELTESGRSGPSAPAPSGLPHWLASSPAP